MNVLITGANRGIGLEMVRYSMRQGWRVFACCRNPHNADNLFSIAKLSNGQISVHIADMLELATLQALSYELRNDAIDILINNAGIYEDHPLAEVSYEEWQKSWQYTLDTNLIGPANISYCAARHMIAQGRGRIVNVSSRGAFRGEPTAPAYGASKAGLNAFSQSMAQALAPHNIFVYAVAPGFVETDMAASVLSGPEGGAIRAQSPLNRVARPEEVAGVVLFLAAEGSDYLTGSIIDVNGASYLRS